MRGSSRGYGRHGAGRTAAYFAGRSRAHLQADAVTTWQAFAACARGEAEHAYKWRWYGKDWRCQACGYTTLDDPAAISAAAARRETAAPSPSTVASPVVASPVPPGAGQGG